MADRALLFTHLKERINPENATDSGSTRANKLSFPGRPPLKRLPINASPFVGKGSSNSLIFPGKPPGRAPVSNKLRDSPFPGRPPGACPGSNHRSTVPSCSVKRTTCSLPSTKPKYFYGPSPPTSCRPKRLQWNVVTPEKTAGTLWESIVQDTSQPF